MIYLRKNEFRTVILTLTEKESQYFVYSGPNYKLYLTETTSGKSWPVLPLYDIASSYTRYNEFNLYMVDTIQDDTEISVDTELNEAWYYFYEGDLTVNEGTTLTIPEDTYLFVGGELNNQGTILNEGNIILTDAFIGQDYWFAENFEQIDPCTFIFNLNSGYYEYVVKNNDNTLILEEGKLLYKVDEIVITAETTQNIIVAK